MRFGREPDFERWSRLVDVQLPSVVKVQQTENAPREENISAAVRRELAKAEIAACVQPGMTVALGVGSRGIHGLASIISTLAAVLLENGCSPFIVPAMGSHGGATADGQASLLESYGVSEATVNAPIRSSMNAVQIGRLSNGLPLFFDEIALSADLIIPINRIKPHTAFRGRVESGITKMLVVGFGKHLGATAFHARGFVNMSENLIEAREMLLGRLPVRFALAVVENAKHETAVIEAVSTSQLPEREEQLLRLARAYMPHLPVEQIDVLVVEHLGKDVSGSGMDPNVTGRYASGLQNEMVINKLVVLDLTEETHGNAMGLGMADITTQRVAEALNADETWINALTSTTLVSARLPVFMKTDRMAIQLAVRTCNQPEPRAVRMVIVRDTLHLDELYVSEALWSETDGRNDLVACGQLSPIPFDLSGNLVF